MVRRLTTVLHNAARHSGIVFRTYHSRGALRTGLVSWRQDFVVDHPVVAGEVVPCLRVVLATPNTYSEEGIGPGGALGPGKVTFQQVKQSRAGWWA